MPTPAATQFQLETTPLREWFRTLGWHAAAGEQSGVELDGHRYLVIPLASRHPYLALLCEAAPGAPFPRYAVRRRICARIQQLFSRPITIFTDAAHRVQVWSWRSREPGGPLARHEMSRPAGCSDREWLQSLRAMVRDLEESDRATAEAADMALLRREVLCALLRRVRHPSAAAFGPGAPLPHKIWNAATPVDPGVLRQCVHRAIEEAEDPDLLRAFWRALTGLAVLDPACGSGSWLLSVLDALEPLYEACLDRMQSWVDDADRARIPESRFSDFRSVLQRAGDVVQNPTRRHFVRESIVLRNLFGAERDASALAAAEMRLLLRVRAAADYPAETHPSSALMCNLREGDLDAGFASLGELRRAASANGSEFARDLLEEVETVDRAEHRLRSLRLSYGASTSELIAGRRMVRLRREALSHEIDWLLALRQGIDSGNVPALSAWRREHRPLHRCVEFYGILRRGGFSLQRSGER